MRTNGAVSPPDRLVRVLGAPPGGNVHVNVVHGDLYAGGAHVVLATAVL